MIQLYQLCNTCIITMFSTDVNASMAIIAKRRYKMLLDSSPERLKWPPWGGQHGRRPPFVFKLDFL